MNFRRHLPDDAPEINLVPLIDVLLVILIFLAATTSFQRTQQLSLTLPQAQAESIEEGALHLAILEDGAYALQGRRLSTEDGPLAALLRSAAGEQTAPLLVIHADAQTAHASVVRAMEAARQAGIARLGFATQALP